MLRFSATVRPTGRVSDSRSLSFSQVFVRDTAVLFRVLVTPITPVSVSAERLSLRVALPLLTTSYLVSGRVASFWSSTSFTV